jgi:hypothetical protein
MSVQWRSQGLEVGGTMASAGARAYMGSGGFAPSGVQGRSPWSGVRGLRP